MTTETQQECPMASKPQREHEWLQRFVGDWTVSEGWTPKNEQNASTTIVGTERVRSLGGLWVVCEGQVQMPNANTFQSIMTLGYDPQKEQFVGTFVASMMTNLWVYDRSELDEARGVLALYAQGPSMDPDAQGKMATYRDTIEFKSDDHRILTSHVQGDDGTWTQVMSAQYRRK